MKLVGFDTETTLISKGAVVPKLICATFAWENRASELWGNGDPELFDKLYEIYSDPTTLIVNQNIAFDSAVVCKAFPELYPTVFEKYEAGQIVDIAIRQKLLDLSTDGNIDTRRYSQNDIGKRHGLPDRSDEKADLSSVRYRFAEMDGKRAHEYPEEFWDYATTDAADALHIYLRQETAKGSTQTDAFHTAAAFSFMLITDQGMLTDLDRVRALEKSLQSRLTHPRNQILYNTKIVRPAEPPRRKLNGTGYTKGKKESVNTKQLRARVVEVSRAHNIPLTTTEPSSKHPSGQVKTDSGTLARLSKYDHALALFSERQKLIKIQSTYLPHLKEGICYFGFNPLVSTGRASSVSSKLYPSMNGQNQPRETGELSVRECFVPRRGNLFLAIDVSALELCSIAQQTYNLFGYSVHRDKINDGFDLHAFLGAQIAYRWDKAFRETCDEAGLSSPEDYYEFFKSLKRTDSSFFKKFRTVAKPTGLGYPGGLGPKKFVDFCFSGYGLEISESEARDLREMWFQTYPEMRDYFRWVKEQADPHNYGFFRYVSPLGMVRSGATFTATANGFGLQTPSAEAVKIALIRLVRACFDYTVDSPMYGCRPVNMIHDEILWEIPDDSLADERRRWCQETFEKSLSHLFTDVRMTTEPTLMRRWYKQAEPTYDEQGRLIPWEE